jgi:hypothetical protein
MFYMLILALLSLLAAIAWFITKPAYDSGLAIMAALSAIGAALILRKKKRVEPRQNQIVSNSSIAVQAGRDAKVGTISGKKHEE